MLLNVWLRSVDKRFVKQAMLMKNFLLIVVLAVTSSCTKTVYVPVERKVTVTQTLHDTVVQVRLEKEIVRVATRDTIARAETSYAKAEARWTREQLALDLENKNVEIPVEVKYVKIIQRDSIPYPVEAPVLEKVRYVAWYDKVIRWLALGVIIASVFGITLFDLRKLWKVF